MGSKPPPSPVTLLGMGASAAVCLGAGIGAGYWLDETFRTGLLLTFIGLVIGLGAAIVVLYLEMKSFL